MAIKEIAIAARDITFKYVIPTATLGYAMNNNKHIRKVEKGFDRVDGNVSTIKNDVNKLMELYKRTAPAPVQQLPQYQQGYYPQAQPQQPIQQGYYQPQAQQYQQSVQQTPVQQPQAQAQTPAQQPIQQVPQQQVPSTPVVNSGMTLTLSPEILNKLLGAETPAQQNVQPQVQPVQQVVPQVQAPVQQQMPQVPPQQNVQQSAQPQVPTDPNAGQQQ